MKTDTTYTLGHLLHISFSSCSFAQMYTYAFSEVYSDYLKIGIIKCKLVKVSHIEFQQNLFESLWNIRKNSIYAFM